MTPAQKVYLGDGVYAALDGFHVTLTTENGCPDDPSNRIALEPAVYHALNDFVQAIQKEREASDESHR